LFKCLMRRIKNWRDDAELRPHRRYFTMRLMIRVGNMTFLPMRHVAEL